MVEVVKSTGGIKVTCQHCKSVLRYSSKEVKTVYRDANYGGETPQSHLAIECPVCGQDHPLN